MSRRTLIYTVKSDNRDKGKKFQITEMSASRGEAWAMRALLAKPHRGLLHDPRVGFLLVLFRIAHRRVP